MSVRTVERLARAEAELKKLDEVILVVVLEDPVRLLGALRGTAKTRARAVADWYRAHPDRPPARGHVAVMRAGGIHWKPRQAADVGSGSTRRRRTQRPTRP